MDGFARSLRTLAATLALGLAVAPVHAAQDSVQEVVTDSGMRIWSFPDDGGERFVLMVQVGSGSRDEKSDKAGEAHFLEHVLLTSSTEHPKNEMRQRARDLGLVFNGFTTQERTTFYLYADPANWRPAVDWLAELLVHPGFTNDDIAAERKIVIEELDWRNPHAGALTFESLLYPDEALGRPIGGSKAAVSDITSDDLKRFFGEHYRAQNIAIGFAGRVARRACFDKLRESFAGFASGDVEPRAKLERIKSETMVFGSHEDEESSAEITLGYHLPPGGARELAIELTLERYLDERFNHEVREVRQLSYAPTAALKLFSDTHRLEFETHVSNEYNLPTVIDVSRALIEELQRPDAAQLASARGVVENVLRVNNCDDLGKAMELAWLMRRRGETPDALAREARAVDANAVAEFATKNLTPTARFVVTDSPFVDGVWNPFVIVALVLFALALTDGLRGFVWARALASWLGSRRRRTPPAPARSPRKERVDRITPVDGSELERSFHRYFEEQDRKQGR